MSSLGFYPVDPVSGNYVFGTPLVDRAELDMGNGRKLTVQVNRKSGSDPYIQSVTLNGKPHTKLWFRHADIAEGGSLEFTMGPAPSAQFGAGSDATPPSLATQESNSGGL